MISKNQIKYCVSLKRKKYREQEKKFIVEGLRLYEEALASDYEIDSLFYLSAKVSSPRAKRLIDNTRQRGIPAEELDQRALKQIAGTVESQGIVGIVNKKRFDLAQFFTHDTKLLVALDGIRDPGNLGTIIRSASWFGAGGILLSENSVEFTNPKVVRASMGCVLHLPILEELNLLENLKTLRDSGYTMFVADTGSHEPYSKSDFSSKSVLIFGNEVTGVSPEIKEMASSLISIPRRGKGESLNVAVAAGIILAEAARSIN